MKVIQLKVGISKGKTHKMKKIIKKDNSLTTVLRGIFKNNKNISIKNDEIVVNNLHDSFDFRDYLFESDSITNTCSMEELSTEGSIEYALSQFEDFLDANRIKALSDTNTIKILREVFKQQFYEMGYKKKAYILNCIKNSDSHKMVRGQEGWKKVFEYQGNDGVIYTYMWKKQ